MISLPERTVDAWVTAYVVSRVPNAWLWAPTQQNSPDYDLAASLPGRGKLFVLEDKAPSVDERSGQHAFRLPVRQMWNYLRHPQLRLRTFYVLPCPPYPVSAVPGTSAYVAPSRAALVPDRAMTRLAGHPWQPGQGCEFWFRVVPVADLWSATLRSSPMPAIGAAYWPRRPQTRRALPATVPLPCPLPATLGESLKVFMDRLIRCDRPELRVDPAQPDQADDYAVELVDDDPVYQTLIAYVPFSDLAGW
jgi:hypothetical protein